MKPTDPPVIVEQTFEVSIEELWAAITDPEQMRLWFFEQIPDFRPEVDFRTTFSIEHGDKQYQHVWRIAEVVPGEKIVYDWSYEGLPGRGLVTWDLLSEGNRSSLKITNAILEAFPQDDPAFHRESCEAGWDFLINDQLVDHLTPMSPNGS